MILKKKKSKDILHLLHDFEIKSTQKKKKKTNK